MKHHFWNIVHILFSLKKRWIVVLDVLSSLSLVYIFTQNLNHMMLAYSIYLLSFYSLIITMMSMYELTACFRSHVLGNRYIHKYNSNIQFRMKIKLYTSVLINVAYALLKLIIGCYYQSIWEIHLGIYYMIICLMRLILLKQVHYRDLGNDKISEYKKYKLCSYYLLALNLVLSGVVILMAWRNYTYQYAGYLIYIAAMYTFYTTINAVINVVKYCKYESPLINAINIVCFITALVSVLSLQTAMLTQFGTQGLASKQMANGLTGAFICTMIFVISIYMIIHAKKELNTEILKTTRIS